MQPDHVVIQPPSRDDAGAVRELPMGRVIAFAGVFVLGAAVIVAVLMTRRKRKAAGGQPNDKPL